MAGARRRSHRRQCPIPGGERADYGSTKAILRLPPRGKNRRVEGTDPEIQEAVAAAGAERGASCVSIFPREPSLLFQRSSSTRGRSSFHDRPRLTTGSGATSAKSLSVPPLPREALTSTRT